MTSEEIRAIILEELKSEQDMTNVAGVDLTKCLIEPTRQSYKRSNDALETYQRWTVLEEREDKNGYKIYFDEGTKLFGLALNSDSDELIDIGTYGSFIDTLWAL